MTRQQEEELAVLKQARPYIRSLLAFILHIKFAGEVDDWSEEMAYEEADRFIRQLENDVKTTNNP